ncbi:hypothetical protein Lnau_2069 [Legionella nautarum]|uniref:Uncharacterized protein n=1 Tax=Legionella nautarum TaxID=45070 RepID=A0A0W0WNM8_9GAMM|nr:hypothetical protein [Legionella nautarum]KTD33925.1 hypothetical protein Lnau_2069 [Legionella nautarum]
MGVYVFNAEAIQGLPSVICFLKAKTRKSPFVLEITFRNFFIPDYEAWDKQTEGEVSIEKIVEISTQHSLNYSKLPFIAQLDIRCRCYNYLRINNLLHYPNVIPFQSLPYRMPSLNDWPKKSAEIIPFSQTE